MKVTFEQLEIIQKARAGDFDSLEKLAEEVRPQILAYIYRLTLKWELAQDLTQDTLLDMVKSLWRLESAQSFWAWLYRTALGKVQHHFRESKVRGKVKMSAINKEQIMDRMSGDLDDGLSYVQRKELSDIMFEAMKKLKVQYRNILTLRCLEQLSYAEIADVMDRSELDSRVLFFRAKNALKKQLIKHGYNQNAMLTGIGLFGLITFPTKATSSVPVVSASCLDVGLLPSIIATATTNLGITITAFIASAGVYLTVKNIMIVGCVFGAMGLIILFNCLVCND